MGFGADPLDPSGPTASPASTATAARRSPPARRRSRCRSGARSAAPRSSTRAPATGRPPASSSAGASEHGLGDGLLGDDYEERLADVETTIGVGPVPLEVMGNNGRLALAGAAALGLESGPLQRNAPGCRGACQCAIGCPNNAKMGVHLNALPQACEAGARIASGVHAERLILERGRAVGVRCRTAAGSSSCGRPGSSSPPARPRRRRCCAAAASARIPRLGRGMSIHPALGVAGRFEEPVVAWEGVMQSAGIEEYHEREGVLLEATSTPPGMGSMVAARHRRGAARPARGRRPPRRARGDDRRRALRRGDRHRPPASSSTGSPQPRPRPVAAAAGHSARILLAAGAAEVEIGAGLAPARTPAEVDERLAGLEVAPPAPRRLPPDRHRRRRLRSGPAPERARRPPARGRGRLGRRRLDRAQLPDRQPADLDHVAGDRGRPGDPCGLGP